MKVSRSIMLALAGMAAVAGLTGCGNSTNPLALGPELDTTPPPAPQSLYRDNDASGQPILVWTESAAPDLAGYQVYVYSALPGGGNGYVPVDDTVILDSRFTIPSDTFGTTASYRVRAVDEAGNWSALSAAVEVYIPTLSGGSEGKDLIEVQ